jgi:PAS domain S-box-containing protein
VTVTRSEHDAPLVLTVNDDEVTRDALRQILERNEFEVVETGSASEAVELARDRRPTAVLLDVNLPDGDGIAVTAQLKAGDATRLIPVLQLSATRIGIEDRVAGLDGGADAYLTWPVDPPVLVATLRALIRARRAEAEASLMGRQWQATVEAARDGLAILDERGRVVRSNRRLADLTGRDVPSLLGIDLPALLDADGTAGLARRTGTALQTGRPDRFETKLGSTWQRVSLDPINDETGHVRGLAIGMIDMTETRRLYEAEREARMLLASVVAQMPIGILVADDAGRIVLHNRQLEMITRRSYLDATLDDTEAWTGIRYEGRPLGGSDSPFLRVLREGVRFDDRELQVDVGDEVHTLQFSAAPILVDGRAIAVVAAVSDITGRKRIDALRDTFIGILSHELRTPVTTILGGSRLLDNERRTLDEATRAELVHDITAEAERLHRLVEDLLVLARTERGVSMRMADPVLVRHIIPRVVADEKRFWPGLEVETSVSPLPTASGDAAYVEQVLRNLLSNAAKYGAAAGPVRIAAEASEAAVQVTVRDHGPGIATEDLPFVFDLFYRAKSAVRSASGAGIGLFVCRQLVEAMGGQIWARRPDDGGTEFGFTLPQYRDGSQGIDGGG